MQEDAEEKPAPQLADKRKKKAKPPLPSQGRSARARLFRRENSLAVRVAADAHAEEQVPTIIKVQAAFRGMHTRRQLRRQRLIDGSYAERDPATRIVRTRPYAHGCGEAADNARGLRDAKAAKRVRERARPRVKVEHARPQAPQVLPRGTRREEQEQARRRYPEEWVWVAYAACIVWNTVCAVYAARVGLRFTENTWRRWLATWGTALAMAAFVLEPLQIAASLALERACAPCRAHFWDLRGMAPIQI